MELKFNLFATQALRELLLIELYGIEMSYFLSLLKLATLLIELYGIEIRNRTTIINHQLAFNRTIWN